MYIPWTESWYSHYIIFLILFVVLVIWWGNKIQSIFIQLGDFIHSNLIVLVVLIMSDNSPQRPPSLTRLIQESRMGLPTWEMYRLLSPAPTPAVVNNSVYLPQIIPMVTLPISFNSSLTFPAGSRIIHFLAGAIQPDITESLLDLGIDKVYVVPKSTWFNGYKLAERLNIFKSLRLGIFSFDFLSKPSADDSVTQVKQRFDGLGCTVSFSYHIF